MPGAAGQWGGRSLHHDGRADRDPLIEIGHVGIAHPEAAGRFRLADGVGVGRAVVATDGDKTWRTPYDDCVLVMPSLVHLKPGTTMVRLGRYD